MAGQKETGTGISIRPDAFKHGGGLINDVDALIKQARWGYSDFNGKAPNTLVAHLTYEYEDADGAKLEEEGLYSCGKKGSENFTPSKDGKTLQQVGGESQLSDGCNFFTFISSVVNAGYPTDQIEGSDISFLDGLKVHLLREKQPERSGIAKREDGRESTVLCISKIYNLPGQAGTKAAGKGASAPAAAKGGKANGAAAGSADVESAAVDAVLDVLGDAGGTLQKKEISQKLFASLKGKPMQKEIIQMAFRDEFLSAEGRPWTFADNTVSLG